MGFIEEENPMGETGSISYDDEATRSLVAGEENLKSTSKTGFNTIDNRCLLRNIKDTQPRHFCGPTTLLNRLLRRQGTKKIIVHASKTLSIYLLN